MAPDMVYIVQRGEEFVVLLCGGDKSSQDTVGNFDAAHLMSLDRSAI
jgi:putative component of toxin-antitoxin plasmid stabilization module